MRIALAQIDPIVGGFEANTRLIEEAYLKACQENCRILLTPEMGLCGYPPHDLLLRPEMVDRCEAAVDVLAKITKGQKCALVVGHVSATPGNFGRSVQNVVTVLEGGKRVFKQAKRLLPTHDVFDEARYFEPETETKLWECDGRKIVLAICEDLWAKDPMLGRAIYRKDPCEDYKKLGPDLLLSISASPYEWGKRERREKLHSDTAKTLGCPLIYINQTGATDEILFDGASFAVNSKGELVGRMKAFQTSFGIISVDKIIAFETQDREDQAPEENEILLRALVTGIKEYFRKTGFRKAILGLSGGIDSAVVAVLAVQALGRENVLGVAMPSQYSAPISLEDAESLAKNLGIKLEVRPIKFIFSTFSREIANQRKELSALSQENLQSRLRGVILMTLSNNDGSLVLTTGNKSELATGYCTLYGDMVGAIAPIGDLFKTQVYDLANFINKKFQGVIPERSISRPPTAELKPNQTDQDTLPPYDVLDALLKDYLALSMDIGTLRKKYGDKMRDNPQWVDEVIKRVEMNEYKRRQAVPALKVSSKAFGIGRRIPVAKTWDASLIR